MPSASRTSTCGVASSSRRPPEAASRWASRRTASSSGKRDVGPLQPRSRGRRRPASAPLTRTSVTPGSRSSGSSGPGADHVAAQRLVHGQHRRVADRSARRPAAPRPPGEVSARPGRGPAARGPPRRARRRRLHHAARAAIARRRARPGPGRRPAERAAPRTAPGPSPRSIDSGEPALVGHPVHHRRTPISPRRAVSSSIPTRGRRAPALPGRRTDRTASRYTRATSTTSPRAFPKSSRPCERCRHAS